MRGGTNLLPNLLVNLLAFALPFWLFNCPLPAPNARCGKEVQMASAPVCFPPHSPPFPFFRALRFIDFPGLIPGFDSEKTTSVFIILFYYSGTRKYLSHLP